MRHFLSFGGWNRQTAPFSSSLFGGTSEFRDPAQSAQSRPKNFVLDTHAGHDGAARRVVQ